MSNKKRVLFVSEASFLPTGFSVYANEILTRLYRSGKYEIAEFASGASASNPHITSNENRLSRPWLFYCNIPDNDQELQFFNSHPSNPFGRWRFEEVVLDFKPDYVCVKPQSLVMTINGHKPICDIKVGDLVLTHMGRFKPVLKVHKHQHIGEMQSIKAKGLCHSLTITDEHPLYIYPYKKRTNKNKRSFKKIYSGDTPEFVSARKVKKQDLITQTKISVEQKNVEIDISKYLVQFIETLDGLSSRTRTKTENCIPKVIPFSKELARLIGYIISDGHISESGINIYFSIDELSFCEDARFLFQQVFNQNASILKVKDKECWKVGVNSRLLSEFLKKWIIRHKFPSEIYNTPTEVREQLVKGLICGDGCYKKNTISFSSSDKNLAYDYRTLLLSLDIPSNIAYNKKNKNYEVNVYGEPVDRLHKICNKKDYNPRAIGNKKSCRCTQIIDDKYLISSVVDIHRRMYRGQVYNLEVADDNSYVVEQVCVHNCDYRDPWYFEYQYTSPLRDYYKWLLMPTLDSNPVRQEWLDMYSNADKLITYSRYGKEVIEAESEGRIKVFGVASPGADLSTFKPVLDKIKHKESVGLNNDSFIVGFVSRNQKRKLFPDFFAALRLFIDKYPEESKRLLGYCHTSYPDAGWNIPNLLKEYNLSRKVLFTYICRNCGVTYPSFYNDIRCICRNCGQNSAFMPNVQHGVSRESLAGIMNLFDAGVQWASNEGSGMAQQEIAACGVPLISVDHTAMSSVVRECNGTPIPPKALYREVETDAYKATPDNEKLAETIYELMQKTEDERKMMGAKGRLGVMQSISYDKAAQVWMDAIDQTQSPPESRWTQPPKIFNYNLSPPNLPPKNFIDWCVINILGDSSKLNSYFARNLVRSLSNGIYCHPGGGGVNENSAINARMNWEHCGPETIINIMKGMRDNINHWETRRVNPPNPNQPFYIQQAHNDMVIKSQLQRQ